tara:strand:- start:4231 stop:5919 length:1689 start_codon:yes stop_codon:yes gene_type:complete
MSKYLIKDSKDILIPSVSDFFALWCVDNEISSLQDLDKYALENGIEKLEYAQGWMDGLVDADLFRPYILILNKQIYIGIHILDSGRIPLNTVGKDAAEKKLFNNYLDLSRLIRDRLQPSGSKIFGRFTNDYFDGFKNSSQGYFKSESPSDVLNINSTAKSINSFIADNPMSMEMIEKTFEKINTSWGTMIYVTCGDENTFFRPMQGKDSNWINKIAAEQAVQRYLNGLQANQNVTHYQLTGGSVCWGDQQQEHYAYYIDELVDFDVFGKILYLNWLENPLAKETKSYLIQVEEERKRLIELERFNRISVELEEYTKENVRAEIRLHNQLMNQRKGKVTDGVYFDNNKIKYLMAKFTYQDDDIYPKSMQNNINSATNRLPYIYSTIQQIPGYITNNSNQFTVHPKLDKFMITLFGKDYCSIPYETQADYQNYINTRDNRALKIHWSDSPSGVERLSMSDVWFEVLMNSGLNLSEYIVEDLTYYGGKVEIKEDTLAFNFMKPKGRIMKSKLYKDIKLGLERLKAANRFNGIYYDDMNSPERNMSLFFLPKWMFIKYVGGKEVDF